MHPLPRPRLTDLIVGSVAAAVIATIVVVVAVSAAPVEVDVAMNAPAQSTSRSSLVFAA
jgi:hypothetical protein